MPKEDEINVHAWFNKLSPEKRAQLDAAANQMWDFFRKVKETADYFVAAAAHAAARADRGHERSELLRLYKQRTKWKTADIGRLNTYRLNKGAYKRVAALASSRKLGPGATVPFQTWPEQMAMASKYVMKLSDPQTGGVERLRLLRRHRSWYPQFVEMTYRGEYERLRHLGIPSPYEAAEQAVAEAFLISRASVHRFCVEVRKDFAAGHTMSPGVTVAELEQWKQSGNFPEHGKD